MKNQKADRASEMIREYGEAVKMKTVMRILDCSRSTVYRMTVDGRLRTCCGGTRVDVRSIAEYIEAKEVSKYVHMVS